VPRLALVGNLCRDVVDGGPPRIGGGAFYAARAWRTLGARATIFTRCGPDERTAYSRRLISVGLPVVMLQGTSTTAFSFYYVDSTRFMTVEHTGDTWTPADVRQVAPGAWVHVAPLLRSEFPAETLAALARGRRLSLDGQGLVRVPELGPLRLDADFDRALLRHLQILKLAEEEADVIGAVDRLGVPEILVTYGPKGSRVYSNGRWEQVGAWPVATDPTGCGDAFSAAYLAGRSGGLSPTSAARRATALVSAILLRRVS
jgi:sugar/nucleoside kinase (ribokinase family)